MPPPQERPSSLQRQDVLLDGELFRQRTEEFSGERKGMHLQGHGEMRPRFDEAAHPEFGITTAAKDLDLYRVHERMEQGAQRDVLVEDDYIPKCERIHVADLGGFEPAARISAKKAGAVMRGAPRNSRTRTCSKKASEK